MRCAAIDSKMLPMQNKRAPFDTHTERMGKKEGSIELIQCRDPDHKRVFLYLWEIIQFFFRIFIFMDFIALSQYLRISFSVSLSLSHFQ